MCVCRGWGGGGGAVYWSLLVCKCVSWRVCAQVCTHSVILVPVLSDAHRERQIHSEKQIVPLWWVWSGLREKRQSENQRRNGEQKTDKVPTSVSKSEARCIVYLLFAFCHSSLHQKESFIFFAFTSCSHLHAFLWENSVICWQGKWIAASLNILITVNSTAVCWERILLWNQFILEKKSL